MLQKLLSSCAVLILVIAIISNIPTLEPMQKPLYNAPTYSLNPYPSDGSTISSGIPKISWQISPHGAELLAYGVTLDGKAVKAQLISRKDTLLVMYQPSSPLAAGRHTVEMSVSFRGYRPAAIAFSFTVTNTVPDPFANLDTSKLRIWEESVLSRMNEYRRIVGLHDVALHRALTSSAQAHSNYLSNHTMISHNENEGEAGFTGTTPQRRAELFGYDGFTGEGIDYGNPGSMAVDRLIDAPYHRISIMNPVIIHAGVGFSDNITVINYGGPEELASDHVIAYPYPGQQDAKIAWLNAETPNPLAFYGKGKITVAYPISLSIHGAHSKELRALSAVVTDDRGQTIPCYQVDSSRDQEHKTALFLIPELPLRLGTTYTAAVKGEIIDERGQSHPLKKTWSFRTVAVIGIAGLEIFSLNGTDHLAVMTRSGEISDFQYVLKRNGSILRQYSTAEGIYTGWGERHLSAGEYQLELYSSQLSTTEVYDIRINQGDDKLTVDILP